MKKVNQVNLSELNDLELVKRFKKGSKPAFEELVHRHEAKVYSLAMRYTKSTEDSEEVTQDVFITLYNKVNMFEGKSAFTSWLYRIVVNTAFMKLRKRRQNRSISVEDLNPNLKDEYYQKGAEDIQASDYRSTQHETRDALEKALARIPEEYRSVFVMRDVDGLSNEEVSEKLEISVAAVKSRLHRARIMLQKRLVRYWNDYTGTEAMVDMAKQVANC